MTGLLCLGEPEACHCLSRSKLVVPKCKKCTTSTWPLVIQTKSCLGSLQHCQHLPSFTGALGCTAKRFRCAAGALAPWSPIPFLPRKSVDNLQPKKLRLSQRPRATAWPNSDKEKGLCSFVLAWQSTKKARDPRHCILRCGSYLKATKVVNCTATAVLKVHPGISACTLLLSSLIRPSIHAFLHSVSFSQSFSSSFMPAAHPCALSLTRSFMCAPSARRFL